MPVLIVGALVVLTNAAFWGGVIYIACHFIGKFW
jgi:hypothetical protein